MSRSSAEPQLVLDWFAARGLEHRLRGDSLAFDSILGDSLSFVELSLVLKATCARVLVGYCAISQVPKNSAACYGFAFESCAGAECVEKIS